MTPPDQVAESLLVHASFVRRLANRLTGGDGDDLAQDAWSAALQSESRNVRDATGWLATIVKNLWRNRRRGELRRVARESVAGSAEHGPSIASILELEEARRHVVAAVVALPERLRAVVLCRYYEDLDSTAIGERLGLPASTVRSRLREAHEQLRASLDAQHGDRRAWAAPLAGWCSPRRAGAAVLRTAVSLRIAAGAAAVLLLAWWAALASQPAPTLPPQGPVGTVQVASHDGSSPVGASPRAEREAVASAAVATIGPEDLPGRVVDAVTGAPVANAEVVLEHRDSDEFAGIDVGSEPTVDRIGTARSDGDGRFSFRVQRALQHRLTVTAAGYAKVVLRHCTGGSEVIVRVAAPATITGVIRRKSDGAPLADADVETAEYGVVGGDRIATRTAVDGTFVLSGLAPLSAYVRVRAIGMQRAWQRVEVSPAMQRHIEFALESGGSVRGIVRDGVTKQPVAGARVAWDAAMRMAVVSERDGAFMLHGVGDRDQLHVHADGYAPQVVFRGANDGEAPLDVMMSAGSAVVGRIVDRDGRQVSSARVAVVVEVVHASGTTATRWCPADVGADGVFRIAAAPVADPGSNYQVARWQVSVRAPGCGARAFALEPELLQRRIVDLGDMVLAAEAILEGRLVEREGTAVADAEVVVTGTPNGFVGSLPGGAGNERPLWHCNRTTRTAPDGAFRVAGIAAGSYSLAARSGSEDLDLPTGVREIADGELVQLGDLRVDRGESISGVVRFAGGRAVNVDDLIYVMAWNEKTMNRGARVKPDGSFRIERLEPGKFTLHSVDTPKGFTLVPRADVAAGTSNVELVLVPAEVFEGTVVDADGHAVPRAKVVFFPEGAGAGHYIPADEQGRFRVDAAPGVRGKLSAQHPDDQWYQVSLPDMVAPQSGLVMKLRRGFF